MDLNVNTSPAKSLLAPLNVAQKQLADILSASYSKIIQNQAKETFSYVEFSLLLVRSKINHPKDFNRVAEAETIMPIKKLHSFTKLVLEKSVPFRKAMKVNGKNVDLAKNVALLKIDNKMQKITLKSISNMIEPSRAKLQEMKEKLTDAEFETVLSGNDTPYLDYKAKLVTKKQENHKAEKPENLSEAQFNNLHKAGIYPAIKQVAEFMKEVNTLKVEKQDFISEIANLKGQLQVFEKMVSTVKVDFKEAELQEQIKRVTK